MRQRLFWAIVTFTVTGVAACGAHDSPPGTPSKAANNDTAGCDTDNGQINTNGPGGACCDVHDQCYWQYGCNSGSWLSDPESPCETICNADVVACESECLAEPLLPGCGPSACVSGNYCGMMRCGYARDPANGKYDIQVLCPGSTCGCTQSPGGPYCVTPTNNTTVFCNTLPGVTWPTSGPAWDAGSSSSSDAASDAPVPSPAPTAQPVGVAN